ncbi:PilZ domain-containing protein [Isoalcanivorax indicus]|uniref:PilZ domain-containing protein n=1 Tax=Isoalcanivorax indicus TaxID=2202653 RepID=UPI000DBA6ECB|nr:PilZ domain-containing protein [Isoalcanivorax indicus]
MSTEKRRYTRTPFDGEAHLAIDGNLFSIEVMDLSLRGALVNEPAGYPLPVGAHCTLKLLLEDSDIHIPLECTVVRSSRNLAGLSFERIDVEAMQHLRRLLALHLGDDEGPDRLWLEEPLSE